MERPRRQHLRPYWNAGRLQRLNNSDRQGVLAGCRSPLALASLSTSARLGGLFLAADAPVGYDRKGVFWRWVGGFLLLIGLFTRPVAFLLSGEMAVAYWMVHAPRNIFPALNGGGSEPNTAAAPSRS